LECCSYQSTKQHCSIPQANSDIKIILGDFDAKVCKEVVYKSTTDNESLHNEINNRINMIQFKISKGFNIGSTTFLHKDIHQQTWYSADGRRVNQIDHVLISNRLRSAIRDVRALRGPDSGSDHNLFKINFKVKSRVKSEKKYEERKIVNIFQNSKWKQEYAIELNNRFEMLENEDNINNKINEKWENKTIIKEIKQQLIEIDESTDTLKNRWYDEECKTTLQEIKKEREKWLIKGRRENEKQEYHHKRKAQKIIMNKKNLLTYLLHGAEPLLRSYLVL
jgi:hypothetical protein